MVPAVAPVTVDTLGWPLNSCLSFKCRDCRVALFSDYGRTAVGGGGPDYLHDNSFNVVDELCAATVTCDSIETVVAEDDTNGNGTMSSGKKRKIEIEGSHKACLAESEEESQEEPDIGGVCKGLCVSCMRTSTQ